MKAVIGNSLIAKLKPKEKQYDVRDTSLKGFIIRVTPLGKMSYVCQYGRGRRVNIGQVGTITPAQARDKAKQILSQAVMGVLAINSKSSQKMTLKSFIDNDYETWRLANRKAGKEDLKRLRANFVGLFGDHLLNEISPMLIEKWRTNRINSGTHPATVNRDIISLKAALAKAVEWELIQEHPLIKLKPFKIDAVSKVRYLDHNEEERLYKALQLRDEELKTKRVRGNKWREERGRECMPDLRQLVFADYLTPMVLVSLNTGLRRGELFNLHWHDIDFARAILTIRGSTAKSGKTRHVPLNSIAIKALKNWQTVSKHDDLIFSSNKTGRSFNNVKKAWASLLGETKANIKNFRWHDMRHHFASKLVMAGVDLNTVRELLGHADIKMTLRYAHLAPEHKANAVAKLVKKNVVHETQMIE
ncbi:MAG: phage integrase [Gammaproteobacteria bacterium]